jgi:hypothetical protein
MSGILSDFLSSRLSLIQDSNLITPNPLASSPLPCPHIRNPAVNRFRAAVLLVGLTWELGAKFSVFPTRPRRQRSGIAVLCSSDKLYPEVVRQVAPKLKAAGARSVVLAGNPGPNETEWRAAGVDRFVFVKCDVLATLREMLREEGVLTS